MGKITIDNLETGMVLASDVHDRSGRMLLGAGAELSQKHLVIFRTWGVLDADIVGQGDDESSNQNSSEIDPAELAAAEQAVAHLFNHTNRSHPAISELIHLAALRRVLHGTV